MTIYSKLAKDLRTNPSNIPNTVYEETKQGNFDIRLLGNDCMTSFLFFSPFNMQDFRGELVKKATTGMSQQAQEKHVQRLQEMRQEVKKTVSKRTVASDVLRLIQQHPLLDTNFEVETYFKKADPKANPLVPLLAAVTGAKCMAAPTVARAIEVEKILEPIVMALIDTGRVNVNTQVEQLRDQVIALTAECLPEGKKDLAAAYYHDLAVSKFMRMNNNKREFWNIGMDPVARHPMAYVGDGGQRYKLFTSKAKYLSDVGEPMKVTDLLLGNVQNGLYTAMKRIQFAVVGEEPNADGVVHSAVSGSDKITKVLATTLFLLDAATDPEAKTDTTMQRVALAICDPLCEALNDLGMRAKVVLEDSYALAQQIYKSETGQTYTQKSASRKADAGSGSGKADRADVSPDKIADSIAKIMKKSMVEILKTDPGLSSTEALRKIQAVLNGGKEAADVAVLQAGESTVYDVIMKAVDEVVKDTRATVAYAELEQQKEEEQEAVVESEKNAAAAEVDAILAKRTIAEVDSEEIDFIPEEYDITLSGEYKEIIPEEETSL